MTMLIIAKLISACGILPLFLFEPIALVGAQSSANSAFLALLQNHEQNKEQQQEKQQSQEEVMPNNQDENEMMLLQQQDLDGQRFRGGDDVVDTMEKDNRFNSFTGAFDLTNLEERFKCKSNNCNDYTFFIPTNKAFRNTEVSSIVNIYTEDLEYRQLHLKSLLLYHIVAGDISSIQIRESIATNNEDDLLPNLYNEIDLDPFVKDNGRLTIGGARVIDEDIGAQNGVIHAIAKVLLPSFVSNDIISVLEGLNSISTFTGDTNDDAARISAGTAAAGTFEEFVKGLTGVGISGAGRRTQQYPSMTLFVPTDEAFEEISDVMIQINESQLNEIFEYHVLINTIFVANDGNQGARSLQTLGGDNITAMKYYDSISLNNGAKIIQPDILASNGIVQIIDKVLIPPSFSFITDPPDTIPPSPPSPYHRTIWNIIDDNDSGEFDLLFSALDFADSARFMHILDGNDQTQNQKISNVPEHEYDYCYDYNSDDNGPYTLFAPTDAAFGKLGSAFLSLFGTDELAPILNYHIVSGKFDLEDSTNDGNGETLLTLSGDEITVYIDYYNDKILLNGDVQLLSTDTIIASNGIIYVIDKVLLPTDILGLVEDKGYARFMAALEQANLQHTINNPGPYTVFVPTDEAFNQYFGGDDLSTISQNDLVSLLEYHIVPGRMTEDDLMETRVSITGSNNNIGGGSISIEGASYNDSGEISAGSIETLQGGEIDITKTRQMHNNGSSYTTLILNNDATIIETDLLASNGIIHVLDKMLEPKSFPPSSMPILNTIGDIIVANNDSNESFNILKAALQSSDDGNLLDMLSTDSDGPFTMFFPTDAAFFELGSAVINLIGTEDFTDILKYHIVYGQELSTNGLIDDKILTTWSGDTIRVNTFDSYYDGGNDRVFLNNNTEVEILEYQRASNGIIHVINKVLLPKNILDLADDMRYNEFVSAIEAVAGFEDALNEAGPFTVFVPTDAAFNNFEMPSSEEEMEKILLYHVLSGFITKDDLSEGRLRDPNPDRSVITLQGESITITENLVGNSNSIILNEDSTITETDILASNGIMHIVDKVLLPPSFYDHYYPDTGYTIGNFIEKDNRDDNGLIPGEFSILEVALKSVGMMETFNNDPGPFTLFAPTDAAFKELGSAIINLFGTSEFTDILRYHVLDGRVLSDDLTDGISINTQSGKKIYIDVRNNGDIFLNDGIDVTSIDTIASNGVIHVVDKILLPTKIVYLANDKGLTRFLSAVNKAGLLNQLNGSGPFTIFVPTNEAFYNLYGGNFDDVEASYLAQILKYHVLPGLVALEDLVDGRLREQKFAVSVESSMSTRSVQTLQGEDIEIRLRPNGSSDYAIVLNDISAINDGDILASNGIIHVLDTVLTPPSFHTNPSQKTIAGIVEDGGKFDTLYDSLDSVDLIDYLDSTGSGPRTLFAPTDAAFRKFGDTITDLYGTNALKNILKYHIVPRELFQDDLLDGRRLETLRGDDINIGVDNNGDILLNGDARVKIDDIKASNGVIHQIDTVLLPTNSLDFASDEGYTDFVSAVEKSNLEHILRNDSDHFTVFVPTNQAFANYGGISKIRPSDLAEVMLYHIIPGIVTEKDLSEARLRRSLNDNSAERHNNNERYIETLLGENILLEKRDRDINSIVLNGEATVIDTNFLLGNGMVHIIDEVLTPSTDMRFPTVKAIIEDTNSLSRLENTLESVDWINGLLSDYNYPVTIFAPNNDPFRELGSAVTDEFGTNELENQLRYHVLPGRVYLNDLKDYEQVISLNGSPIDVDTDNGDVILNQYAKVKTANIEASNGVVHIIDKVLYPENLLDTATAEGHTQFVAAIKEAKLRYLLKKTGPFTVFVPTDRAFNQFNDMTYMDDSLLELILKYHIVPGIFTKEDFYEDNKVAIKAYQGDDIEIREDNSSRLVINSRSHIINTDILASNGIIHIVDKVLDPRFLDSSDSHSDDLTLNDNILQVAADEGHIKFVEAIEEARLRSLLHRPGPFTVFIPINRAFENFGDLSQMEDSHLTSILEYHILSGIFNRDHFYSENKVTIEAYQGDDIVIRRDETSRLVLNDQSKVINTDIMASNGIIHVVDKVLNPNSKNIFDTAKEDGLEEFAAAVDKANLRKFLDGEGPFTVFAPRNQAFGNMVSNTKERKLERIILYHIVPGSYTKNKLPEEGKLRTSTGRLVEIESKLIWESDSDDLARELQTTIKGDSNDAEVIEYDIQCSNGVIHVIDDVLTPPENVVTYYRDDDDTSTSTSTTSVFDEVETAIGDTVDGVVNFISNFFSL